MHDLLSYWRIFQHQHKKALAKTKLQALLLIGQDQFQKVFDLFRSIYKIQIVSKLSPWKK